MGKTDSTHIDVLGNLFAKISKKAYAVKGFVKLLFSRFQAGRGFSTNRRQDVGPTAVERFHRCRLCF